PAARGGRLPAQYLPALRHAPLCAAPSGRGLGYSPPPLRATFQTHGLGPRHGAILTQLMAGEPASVTDLARRLGVSLSTASQLVGDLARADLVLREEDPRNRRRTLVSIAAAVRPIFEQFLAVRSAALLRAIARLEPADRPAFLAGLAAWAQEEQMVTAAAAPTDRRAKAE
ncbi:MarR family winged helix-turn-helix transcriptional regulator, partial [Nocardia cyriacigeorgica]|uniref:MarR family winged helix-turn-helix transcriptional regulator n=1 Tax=Nocardia cyriacigeorgica TaxID=135487 RepID=UPI0024564D30